MCFLSGMCLVYKAMNEVGKYRKISKAIKYDIFSKLEENMPLPSVRMLSQVYSVNPATIVKALHILKYQGIIYNKRTNGYYVCPNILEMREIFVNANSHFLRTAGPHFPDSPGHIKRTAWDISRAEGSPPY